MQHICGVFAAKGKIKENMIVADDINIKWNKMMKMYPPLKDRAKNLRTMFLQSCFHQAQTIHIYRIKTGNNNKKGGGERERERERELELKNFIFQGL